MTNDLALESPVMRQYYRLSVTTIGNLAPLRGFPLHIVVVFLCYLLLLARDSLATGTAIRSRMAVLSAAWK
jgi:hypothetical protein